ncbi:hypothetical protein ANO11243_027550 [Dothideomycetidae sp. 11243]|nr:hypothetical protein ANO11243_027550 [fungal sp. No.11243]
MRASVAATLFFSALVTSTPLAQFGEAFGPGDQQTHFNVQDRYIVILKPDVDVHNHMDYVQTLHAQSVPTDSKQFEGVVCQYNISDFQGYAGHFPESLIDHIRHHRDVMSVEDDQIWGTDALARQYGGGSGLSLISHREIPGPRDQYYAFDDSLGAGTFAYVVDSGINIEHPEFQGRANLGYNAVDRRAQVWGDKVGHGTMIAGIISSKTFGVAKKTELIAVKVVDGRDGVFSQILDGYQWAVNDIVNKNRMQKAVVHLSPYGPRRQAFDRAVQAATDKGVSTVIPAGNQNLDPSERLAGASAGAIIVSATDERRQRAAFANYGPSVTVFAPGVNIVSTAGVNGQRTSSGTAQAAAYVSGLVAYFKGLNTLLMPSARAVKTCILSKSLPDIVQVPRGPKARFAYNGSGK